MMLVAFVVVTAVSSLNLYIALISSIFPAVRRDSGRQWNALITSMMERSEADEAMLDNQEAA